jgi:hypothetical protein
MRMLMLLFKDEGIEVMVAAGVVVVITVVVVGTVILHGI